MRRQRRMPWMVAAAAALAGCAAWTPGSLVTLGRPGHRVLVEGGSVIVVTWAVAQFVVYAKPDRSDEVWAWLDLSGARRDEMYRELQASTQLVGPDGCGPLPAEPRGLDTLTLRAGADPGEGWEIVAYTQTRP